MLPRRIAQHFPRPLSVLIAASCALPEARADFDFPDFASTAGLAMVGSTSTSGVVLRLVPATGNSAGAAWYSLKQSVASGFETTFQFQLESTAGADGFAFLLQNTTSAPLGGTGCELGYHGLANSLAVEFDTYVNAGCSVAGVNDPAGLHVSVHSNGTGANSVAESFALASTLGVPDFADGGVHTARVRYASGVLSVFVDNLALPVLSTPLALGSLLNLDNGRAWAGFSAATGGLAERHDVLSWSFVESPPTGGNLPPFAPTITEPSANGQVVNAADVHMETGPFADPDAGDQHFCTDWEIWTVTPFERVWFTSCITGVERLHTHLGDGTFENSHAGLSELIASTNYTLRVRHSDDSNDPLTRWSAWSQRTFATGAPTQTFPLEIEDIAHTPPLRWTLADTSTPLVWPQMTTPPRLVIEEATGVPFFEIVGHNGVSNTFVDAPPMAHHEALRVRIVNGSTAYSLAASDLTFVDDDCETHEVVLPAVSLAANGVATYWITASGASFVGNASQTTPTFITLARSPSPAWSTHQEGFQVEVVATGFQLPVNIAFVPNAGPGPSEPLLYVTELYGKIKVVQRNRLVGVYAANLLNFNPTGAFPGSGEQGLTGITVDPQSGDVIAALLYAPVVNPANHFPKLVRFSSTDGGHTAAQQTTLLDMVGETQGQSHQISNLTLLPDGTLLCHMGDGFDAATAQNLNSYRGKILRLHLDGSPVASNPFYNALDGITARDYVYAYGVRNPFGGEWRAADNSQYCVENGPSVDRFSRIVSGRNYLWDGSDASMANFALYNWNPAHGPVNLAFIQPETFGGSGFPASSMGHAFVSESGPTYALGQNAQGKRITEWVLDANGALVSGPRRFVEYSGYRRATACGLEAGPDGLYFTDLYADLGSNPVAAGSNLLRVFYSEPSDCNGNGSDDVCDVSSGASADQDLNGVPDECDCRGTRYCDARVNSLGCTPRIDSSGAATLGLPDDFVVRATSVLSGKQGLLMWGTAPASIPFGGGTRCVATPIRRMPVQSSGGTPGGNDCSGSYAQPFSDADMAANGFTLGTLVYFQFWSRDPGYAPPNNVGLTDALRVMVCP
ncbi:MAG: PQQ-dependent sugar dehydrogenase [Planctomycetes bacterium]|nr:PQQ-dependent sugar dehydrogenase [Planctomycetota bacterium]